MADETKPSDAADRAGASSPPPAGEVPQWRSQDILQGATEALIHHDGQVYRLRLTRQGKLILYK